MSDPFDPYRAWLGICPEEDRNHYRLLGLRLFEESPEVIAAAAGERMADVEKLLGGERAELARQTLDRLAVAKACLLAPEEKAVYDDGIRRELAPSGGKPQASLAAMLLPVGLGVILVFGLVLWGSQWSRISGDAGPVASEAKTAMATVPAAPGATLPAATGPALLSPERRREPSQPPLSALASRTQPAVPVPAVAPASQAPPPVQSASGAPQGGGKLLVNSIGMRLAWIPVGEFGMGSPRSDPAAEPHEQPQHRVRIAKPFFLGACEVTQAEYGEVMGTNPSWFGSGGGAGAVAGGDSGRRPVERVSWEDARAFCRSLSERPEEKAACRVYRLPTEAEWEYACRAGGAGRFGFGDDEAATLDHAWVEGNSAATTHPVGQKRPNAWGLYDMHGNVWEWCGDWYEPGYYRQSPADSPGGPAAGSARVVRGGSFVNAAGACRSATRNFLEPTFRESNGIGFRVVCEVAGSSAGGFP